MVSFALAALAAPMLATFSNTFLWRQSGDPVLLTVYNIAFFIGVPIGFLATAFLLRRFRASLLYALGCILQGVVPIALVFLSPNDPDRIFVLGLVLGITGGFFWGNRNLITSKVTEGEHRFSFISLETASGTLMDLLAPITIGWFLVIGEWFGWYSVSFAYKIAAIAGFLISFLAARAAWQVHVEPMITKEVLLQRPSRIWRRQRWIEILHGFIHGIDSVLPIILILTFVGSEETVGTINFIVAILAAVVIYFTGKSVRHRDHLIILSLWIILNLIGGTALALLWGAIGVLIYILLSGFADSFRWASMAAVMFELVDREIRRRGQHRFLFLLDREFFLNFGRVAALGLFLLAYHYAPDETLRYTLLVVVCVQVLVRWLLKPVVRSITHHPLEPATPSEQQAE